MQKARRRDKVGKMKNRGRLMVDRYAEICESSKDVAAEPVP